MIRILLASLAFLAFAACSTLAPAQQPGMMSHGYLVAPASAATEYLAAEGFEAVDHFSSPSGHQFVLYCRGEDSGGLIVVLHPVRPPAPQIVYIYQSIPICEPPGTPS